MAAGKSLCHQAAQSGCSTANSYFPRCRPTNTFYCIALQLREDHSHRLARDLLKRINRAFGRSDEAIDLMLFSRGTKSIGLAPIGRWQGLLKQAIREGRFIGVDKERYPRDFATFVRFHQALTRLGSMQTPPPALTLPFFESALGAHGTAHGVACIDHTPLARLPD